MINIFKRKASFIACECPKCKGNLELDSEMKVAFCQNCGVQCVVTNIQKHHEKKKSNLEIVISFVERQQSLLRKDKLEKEKQRIVEEKKSSEWWSKYWWILPLILAICFVITFVMAYLEKA